jgi:hypothetical protein
MVHVIPHPFIVFCVGTIVLIIIAVRWADLQTACVVLWFILLAVTIIGQGGIVL